MIMKFAVFWDVTHTTEAEVSSNITRLHCIASQNEIFYAILFLQN
jgi:hypothetical protein